MIGEGVHETQGTVQSVSEQTDQVTIELDKDEAELHPRYANTIRVPLARVQPLRNEVRTLQLLCILFFFFYVLCDDCAKSSGQWLLRCLQSTVVGQLALRA